MTAAISSFSLLPLLTISKPALLQYFTEALAQLEVSLVLRTLQELFHFILARSKLLLLLLVGRLSCLGFLKWQTPPWTPFQQLQPVKPHPLSTDRCVLLPCISVKIHYFLNGKQILGWSTKFPLATADILNSFVNYKHLSNFVQHLGKATAFIMFEQHKMWLQDTDLVIDLTSRLGTWKSPESQGY